MKSQPLLHLIEPHERAMVEEPEIEPFPYWGRIWLAVFLASAAVVGIVGWGIL